ncbi:MAG: GNAT family N-acetyltransferase [Rhodospirillales bacterium]|nr:MAG: GNAT family N-acetyltransferase [Rhodospirillales bacterium]
MQPSDNIAIRLATIADGPRCNAFYNAAYGTRRTLDQWTWEFGRAQGPTGNLPFAIAELDGEVVGTQALIVIDFLDALGVRPTAKSEETLVAPSMRGKDLFGRLYEPLLAYARDHDIGAIWGFTPARTAFERLGFQVPTTTAQVICALDAAAAMRLRPQPAAGRVRSVAERIASLGMATASRIAESSYRPPTRISLRTEERAPDWADALSHRFIARWGGTTIHRSREYLEWRFFRNPFVQSEFVAAYAGDVPVGYVCVGPTAEGVTALLDAFVADAEDSPITASQIITSLLKEVMTRARANGSSAIRGWAGVTDHAFDRALKSAARRLGWITVRQGNPMIAMLLSSVGGRRQVPPVRDWYISRAFTEGSGG